MQILNVAFGGSLYQDISYATNNPLQHSQKTQIYEVAHSIEINCNSRLFNIFGESTLVNSFHHQSVKRLGRRLFIVANSSDGIVESIELYKIKLFIK